MTLTLTVHCTVHVAPDAAQAHPIATPVASQLPEGPRPAAAPRPRWRQLCWEWARDRVADDVVDYIVGDA